jgi:hypothetical protein
MTGIIFHTKGNDDVTVRGSERIRIDSYIAGLTWNVLRTIPGKQLMKVLDKSDYLYGLIRSEHVAGREVIEEFLERQLLVWLTVRSSNYGFHLPTGHVSADAIVHNTVNVCASEHVKFLAKLHGQCETYAYIPGVFTPWAADLLEQALALNLVPEGVGWEKVLALLDGDPGTVVTSYSVTGPFPRAGSTYDVSWDDGMEWLHTEVEPRNNICLTPKALNVCFGGTHHTAFTIKEYCNSV